MTVKDKNLEAMKVFFPELYERYIESCKKGIKDSRLSSIEWVDTSFGKEKAVVLTMPDGREILLNSSYDSKHEAKVWFRGQESPKGAYILIFGMGNGAFPSEIIKHIPSGVPVLIYEPSMEVFHEAISNSDISRFFSKGIRLIVEGINEDLFMAVMETFLTHENYEDYQIYLSPRYEKAFPDSREKFVRHLAADGIGWMRGIQNTIREEIHLSPFNLLYNLRFLEKGTVVPRLKGMIPKNVPVLLVGAGPSLKKDIDTIRELRDRVYVFAADDICSYLMENDVFPDAFCCVEADKALSYYKDERMKDIPLFTKVNASYKLMDWHRAEKIFGYDEGFMERFYEKYGVPKSEYRYGGNTMTALFSICDELGMKTVVLVGQDMCYGQDGKTHVDTQEGDLIEESGMFTCINNQGKEVKTRFDWFSFLRWYESAIYDCGMERVINTALEGAAVKGTIVMPLKEAILSYGRERDDFGVLLKKTPNTYRGKAGPDLISFYRDMKKELTELKGIIEENPKSEKKSRYLIYEILKLYEIADQNENYVESQNGGIWLLDGYLDKVMSWLNEKK